MGNPVSSDPLIPGVILNQIPNILYFLSIFQYVCLLSMFLSTFQFF